MRCMVKKSQHMGEMMTRGFLESPDRSRRPLPTHCLGRTRRNPPLSVTGGGTERGWRRPRAQERWSQAELLNPGEGGGGGEGEGQSMPA